MEHRITKNVGQRIGLLIAIWTVPGLLAASQLRITLSLQRVALPWWRALAMQLPAWWIWCLFTPLILHLTRRFPLERGRILRALAIHLPTALVCSAIAIATRAWLSIHLWPVQGPWKLTGEMTGVALNGLHFYLITYWAVYGAGHALEWYQRYHVQAVAAARLEARLSDARLEALKTQLQPHFLFNALNSVMTLVRREETERAAETLTKLGDLLRYSLDHHGTQRVTLEEELRFLSQYLHVQQVRFAERLDVQLDIAPDTTAALVPSLLLQPLVENAIRHGIAKQSRTGILEIHATRNDGTLEICIRDNGPGLPADWSIDDHSGVGLSNTRATLKLLYEDCHALDVRDNANGGVCVMISLPFETSNHDDVTHDA